MAMRDVEARRRRLHIPTVIIGRVERVTLPAWGIEGIKAKIDTGARTSSLHVEDVEELGRGQVRFSVVTDRTGKTKTVTARMKRKSHVRSSSGHQELRIIVEARVRIGPVEKDIEISLSSRGDMVYRMLLGRLALEHHFVVDVSHRFLADRANELSIVNRVLVEKTVADRKRATAAKAKPRTKSEA